MPPNSFKKITPLALVSLLTGISIAEIAPEPHEPNMTICNWAGLRSGLIRDTIYLDGGSLWWQLGTTNKGQPAIDKEGGIDGLMYTLNLSHSFDTTKFNETTSLLESLPKTGGNAGNNLAPNYVDGAMLVNDHELLLYGGLGRLTDAYKPPDADAVLVYEAYQYGPERISWESGFIDHELPDGMTRYISNGAVASVPSEDLAFYFSGLRGTDWGRTTDANQTWYLADSLIQVDMSTMRSEQWSNNSLPENVSPRADAELAWIPVGSQGLLIAIGGMTATEDFLSAGLNDTQLADAEERAPAFMTSLPIYDIESEKWFTQNTTGDAPGQLTEFCSVVAPAKDFSSFNIYIYGGYDGLDSTSAPSDDVWILSIPSFTWFKAYSGDTSHGRRGHQCEHVYPDQMFIIGGVYFDEARCLPGGFIQVFNLNTLEFQDVYDPREWSDYTVPDIVTAVIGGSGDGGATKTATFPTSTLSSLFDTSYSKTFSTYYPYPPAPDGSSSSSTPIPVPRNSGLAKWVAPVLGVVLTLVVLSIVAALLLLYRRRRNNRRGSLGGSTAASGPNNRILNWVKGMPASTNPSVTEAEGSVTSTEGGSDPSVSSPVAGKNEVAGKPLFEIAGTEREQKLDPVELATEDNTHYPRNKDFAYPSSSSGKESVGGGGTTSQNQLQGLDLSQSFPSPPSPASRPPHRHTQSDESAASIETAQSPYSPDDIGSRPLSPLTCPSPTSDAGSATPTLQPHFVGSPGGEHDGEIRGPATAATATAAGRQGRSTHHHNISSISANLYSAPGPATVVSPQEESRGFGYEVREGIGGWDGGDRSSEQATPASDSSHQDTPKDAEVKRQPTAGKKSSFGEMLDETDKGGEL